MATTVPTTLATTSSEPSTPTTLTLPPTDIELHLLQSFGTFASTRIVSTYLSLKQWRVLGFFANLNEKVLTTTGLIKIVTFLFATYQRLGHPCVQFVDEAMGRRIINTFVHILLLAQQSEETSVQEGAETTPKLSYEERIRALLSGELPRLQELMTELHHREDNNQDHRDTNTPIVMDLEDFVSKDEVRRLKEANKEEVAVMQQELAAMKAQLAELERAKQKVEQDLTDVHNYQASERGQSFQDMEDELARTKLDAIQKAHDLRKLELVVEAMRRKKKSSTRGKGSTARSITSELSDGQTSPTGPETA